MDLNVLLLSPFEFILRNNGRTVGIMWEVAHAAVTNAVIPYSLEAARISSDTECCPTRSAALLANSQSDAGGRRGGGGGRRLSLPSARICFLIALSVDSPRLFGCTQFVEVGVGVCTCLCVLAPASFEGSYYFLTGLIHRSSQHVDAGS